MRHPRLFAAAVLASAIASAERFDIASFTPPSGWTRESREQVVMYQTVDQAARTYCQISIFQSRPGNRSVQDELEQEWREVALVNRTALEASQPVFNQLPDGTQMASRMGRMRQSNLNFLSALTVYQKGGRVLSVLTNVPDEKAFEKYQAQIADFLTAVRLDAPAAPSAPVPAPTTAAPPPAGAPVSANTLTGAWRRGTASYSSGYNMVTKQWEWRPLQQNYRIVTELYLEPNGTYRFAHENKTDTVKILINESGTYRLAGQQLLFTPSAYGATMESGGKLQSSDTKVPAAYSLDCYIGEHPQHQGNHGLQLRSAKKWLTGDPGEWVTFKRPQ